MLPITYVRSVVRWINNVVVMVWHRLQVMRGKVKIQTGFPSSYVGLLNVGRHNKVRSAIRICSYYSTCKQKF